MTDRPGDHERDPEQAFRDGLRRHAEDVSVPPTLVADVAGDRSRPRRRRLAVVATVAAAAAVVAVAVGVDAVFPLGDRGPGGSDGAATGPADAPPSGSASSVPPFSSAPLGTTQDGWRQESWHGLTVSVPSDWGWGTAPMNGGYFCGGPGAAVVPDGQQKSSTTPYVGRPIMLSDACQRGAVLTATPTAPYVWLGADVAPGTVDLGGGYTRQTVEAQGTTLTVVTTDAALRRRIIGSAVSSVCPATIVGQLPQAYTVGQERGDVEGARICVYQRDQELQLVYAGVLDQAQAAAYASAAAADPEPRGDALGPDGTCPTDELADVRLTIGTGDTAVVRNTVVNLTCGWVTSRPGDYRTLGDTTRGLVEGFGGLPAVLASRIGPQG